MQIKNQFKSENMAAEQGYQTKIGLKLGLVVVLLLGSAKLWAPEAMDMALLPNANQDVSSWCRQLCRNIGAYFPLNRRDANMNYLSTRTQIENSTRELSAQIGVLPRLEQLSTEAALYKVEQARQIEELQQSLAAALGRIQVLEVGQKTLHNSTSQNLHRVHHTANAEIETLRREMNDTHTLHRVLRDSIQHVRGLSENTDIDFVARLQELDGRVNAFINSIQGNLLDIQRFSALHLATSSLARPPQPAPEIDSESSTRASAEVAAL